jgi:integrase
LTDWQFRQIVDAVQLLLVDLARAPVASALDWDEREEAGSGLWLAIKRAGLRAELPKRVNSHALRDSFATHLPESGYHIRTVQEFLDHADVSTTVIDTRALNRPGVVPVRSPVDEL